MGQRPPVYFGGVKVAGTPRQNSIGFRVDRQDVVIEGFFHGFYVAAFSAGQGVRCAGMTGWTKVARTIFHGWENKVTLAVSLGASAIFFN